MSKHTRDQALDFQGFLNDLQDWEFSLKDKDKRMKPQASQKDNLKVGEKLRPCGNDSTVNSYFKNYDAFSRISSSLMTEESLPDATSEKELGNEYFKQKKFKEAIDCYSRSIALSPTAVAYANRAMAFLKIKRFQEAEDDCTEALNLDDHYIKAYSRRATARKELGKLKESIEDSELALRLEPQNQEVKKQYAEVKSLYEKEILQKASGKIKSSVQGMQKVGNPGIKVNRDEVCAVPNTTQKTGVVAVKENHAKVSNGENTVRTLSVEEIGDRRIGAKSRAKGQQDGSQADGIQRFGLEKRNHGTRKQDLNLSVHELASRAASRAIAEAAKNIKPPKSAYEFEVSWRGFSGDCTLQACLLKATSPAALPQIFKNALSAPILMGIINTVATFFNEEIDLAVKYLENLTKVPRFDMLIMCLSSKDKADLQRIWDETFCNEATPIEHAEILDNLRSKYCLNR
ncbi:RNA polymerase II-associated protein 3-like isoform X2 [Mangifera indica]|uniref:RNA polymerase II-associated protein 3-like isoform X2 n=1 Tax=Mangifera indica TaxID=29780 RepID=UPI001CF9D373|nr:RNA polymerase II-associated protein 3-like isoform X2 [Mangifera indica]